MKREEVKSQKSKLKNSFPANQTSSYQTSAIKSYIIKSSIIHHKSPKGINHLFPVFLKLEELNVLLVGAGKVGHEKLQAMLRNAPLARIEVVAEEVSEAVYELARLHPFVQIRKKSFDATDLAWKNLVVIAVNDKSTSAAIRQLAKEKNILCNVADTPGQCDFYLGSIVQKGSLKIAISTNGQSPTIAKRVRELLQDALPEELDELIQNLNSIRNRLSGDFTEKVKQLNQLTRSITTDAK